MYEMYLINVNYKFNKNARRGARLIVGSMFSISPGRFRKSSEIAENATRGCYARVSKAINILSQLADSLKRK